MTSTLMKKEIDMRKCKNCKHFRQPVNSHRGECTHPDRNDGKLVYYFGSLKETDYCALYEKPVITVEGRRSSES